MAIVTIGGLLCNFDDIVYRSAFYDILYRRKLKKVDLGDEESLTMSDDELY